jgi:hypothetical protein
MMGPSSDRGGANMSCFPPQPFLDMQKVEVRLMEMDLKLREIADLLRSRPTPPEKSAEPADPLQFGGLTERLFALEQQVVALEVRVSDSNRQSLGLRVQSLEEKLSRMSQLLGD